MHWDCNPWALQEEVERGLPAMFQGLIAIDDCAEEVGGFCGVPGCSRYFGTGLAKQPQHSAFALHLPRGVVNGKAYVPDKSSLRSFVQRFPLRAGDMIVWDSRTAHANFPNSCGRFRLVQFVAMMPADARLLPRGGYWGPTLVTEADAAAVELTPLGRRLLGLDPWDGDARDCWDGEEEKEGTEAECPDCGIRPNAPRYRRFF
eukprot:gene36538-64210_t